MKIDSDGVSLECDFCGRAINPQQAYTWLVSGRPANRRFCSSLCLAKYEGKMALNEKCDAEENAP